MNRPDTGPAPVPPESRERSIDRHESPDAVAQWASVAAGDLVGAVSDAVAGSVATVTRALVDDALQAGRPPFAIRVTSTTTTVDVAVSGGRSVAHRTLSHDVPALAAARRLTTSWTTRLGPDGQGSVVTASVPLRPRRRFAWLRHGSRS